MHMQDQWAINIFCVLRDYGCEHTNNEQSWCVLHPRHAAREEVGNCGAHDNGDGQVDYGHLATRSSAPRERSARIHSRHRGLSGLSGLLRLSLARGDRDRGTLGRCVGPRLGHLSRDEFWFQAHACYVLICQLRVSALFQSCSCNAWHPLASTGGSVRPEIVRACIARTH